PGSPDARISRTVNGDRGTPRGCGEMCDRCIRPDIDPGAREQARQFGPAQLSLPASYRNFSVAPYLIQIGPLGGTRPARRNELKSPFVQVPRDVAPSRAVPLL